MGGVYKYLITMNLGNDEILECYIGTDAITEAYLGEDLVFSSGPFEGLKVSPKSISFNSGTLTATLKVKSSEAWTATTPAWITADVSTGDTGETIITLTATTQTATTQGTITVTSANYEASASCAFNLYTEMAYIYENSNSYQRTHCLNTGILHTASTMSLQIEYYGRGGNSDRMIGYQPDDTGCLGDNNDFRVFGFNSGCFDYNRTRSYTGAINSGYHNLTIGDTYCYDNANSTYLVQQTTEGIVPSPNCPIYIDVSLIKVKSAKIMDGNTVLFDGVAAELNGQYGVWDKVGNQLITNTDITIIGDAL